MCVVVGVDAGASKTHAVALDETGRVLGVGHAGTANWEIVGLKRAQAALRKAIRQALKRARVAPQEVAAAAYGLAGLDFPSDTERLRPVVEGLELGGVYQMVNDAYLPLRAGAPDGVGIGVIAGSGSTVVGRNRSGQTARSFGMGYPMTDWGGGGDITLAAVNAVCRAHLLMDPPTSLTEILLQATGCTSVAAFFEEMARGELSVNINLAPRIAQAAEAGDAAAQAIFHRVGQSIGENVLSVARRLEMLEDEFPIITGGGIFSAHNPQMNESLQATLRPYAPRVRFIHWEAPPVVGALFLALDSLALPHLPDAQAVAQAVSAALA